MTPPTLRRAAIAALVLTAGAAPAHTQQQGPVPGRLEVVGRGAVAHTRTTALTVFRGVDGRDYAYTGTFGQCGGCVGDRVYVWDVTDPARPALTDSVRVDARVVNRVLVNEAGTVAVLTREGAASRRNGIVLLDLSIPAHPRPLGEYWETLLGGAHNAAIAGNYVYVVDAGPSELAVIDISTPGDPREVGRWGVPDQPRRFLQDVAVKDGLAYLSYWDDGLVILDVGNGVKKGTPQQPRLVSQFQYRTQWRGQRYGNTAHAFPYTTRTGRRLVFVGDQILPADANLGRRFESGGYLHVLDATRPETPVEVATYDVPNSGVHEAWAQNDTLYVAAWSGGLRAVDVSGELRGSLRGREIASLATSDSAAAVADFPFAWSAVPYRGLVFATDFNSGLWITRLVPRQVSAGR